MAILYEESLNFKNKNNIIAKISIILITVAYIVLK